MLRVETAVSVEELHARERGWRELYSSAGANNVFLSFDWWALWLQHVVPAENRLIWFFSDGDRLVGIIPMYTSLERHRGMNFTVLRLAGDPDSAYNGPLIAPEFRERVLEQWLLELRHPPRRWDMMVLRDIADEGDVVEPGLRRSPFRLHAELSAHCYSIACRGDYADFFSRTSSVIYDNVPGYERRLAKLGTVDVARISTGDLSVGQAVHEAQEMYARTEKAVRGLGLFRSPQLNAFFPALLSALPAGTVEGSFLRVNGKCIANFIYLCTPGRWIALSTGYDPDFARYSPGKVLFHLDLKRCFSNAPGMVMDLGRGDFAWKRLWTSTLTRNKNITVYSPSFRARLLYLNRALYKRCAALRVRGSPSPA